MRLTVNDYVMIPMQQIYLNTEEPMYLYGIVTGFENDEYMAVVELNTPYKGVQKTIVPAYFAHVMSKERYIKATNDDWEIDIPPKIETNMTCDHNWEYSGESPLTGQTWWNCKNCGVARENA